MESLRKGFPYRRKKSMETVNVQECAGKEPG